jgi:hypothetical protein
MSIQEFALDPTGIKRIQIFQGSSGGDISVLLNKSIVGSISNQEELVAGKEFVLKGGSLLLIRQTNYGYQVMCDGQPLRLMSPADIEAAENRVAIERARIELATRGEPKAAQLPKTSSSEPLLQRMLGFIIIVCGGLLALFAFFSLPYVALGPFSFTGSQVAQNNGFLWLEPIIAGIIVAIAGWQILTSLGGEPASDESLVAIIGLTLLALAILLISSFLQPNYPVYVKLASASISSVTTISPSNGSGFWLYIVGMIIVLVGSAVQIKRAL